MLRQASWRSAGVLLFSFGLPVPGTDLDTLGSPLQARESVHKSLLCRTTFANVIMPFLLCGDVSSTPDDCHGHHAL